MTDEERAELERQEALKALAKWGDELTAGLKGNRDTIKAEKADLQKKFDELTAKWGDLDPEKVTAVMTRLDNDEEMKLISEGKLEDVVERRTESMRKDFSTRLEAATKKIDELNSSLGARSETLKRLTIDSKIREGGLAMETPIDVKAISDAIRAGRDIFSLDEEDNVIALREDGSPIIGKDGKTALGIDEWLATTFAEGKTLWWGASSGGGAMGGGEGGGKGPDADAVEKMSPRQKLGIGLADQVA